VVVLVVCLPFHIDLSSVHESGAGSHSSPRFCAATGASFPLVDLLPPEPSMRPKKLAMNRTDEIISISKMGVPGLWRERKMHDVSTLPNVMLTLLNESGYGRICAYLYDISQGPLDKLVTGLSLILNTLCCFY